MSVVPGIETTEPESTQAPTTLEVVDLSSSTEPNLNGGESVTDLDSTGNNDAPVAQVTEPQPEQPNTQVDEVLEALMGAIAPAHMATKHVKIFIYGAEGCGKTVLAAQSPGALIADCDKEGAISLLNFPTLRETKVMPVRSIFAVEKLIGYLKQGHPNFDWVETLAIDPFDDLVYRGLSEQVRNTPGGFNNQERMNQFLAEGYDYNINTERFHQMMDEIKSLDRHVIITAHVTEKEDKKTGRILIRSNITPKLATIIGGAVSLVGYMQYDADKNERLLYTSPTSTITAKSRLMLPPVITNPSFNSILEAFNKIKDAQ